MTTISYSVCKLKLSRPIATKPNIEWSFIDPVGRRRGAKIVAMPGGVGSNPDGVPTSKGTEISALPMVSVNFQV